MKTAAVTTASPVEGGGGLLGQATAFFLAGRAGGGASPLPSVVLWVVVVLVCSLGVAGLVSIYVRAGRQRQLRGGGGGAGTAAAGTGAGGVAAGAGGGTVPSVGSSSSMLAQVSSPALSRSLGPSRVSQGPQQV